MDIRHNETGQRFEVDTPGGPAVLTYRLSDNVMALTHTGVPKAAENRGFGAALVRAALAYAREHHMLVKPLCSFVVTYLRRYPKERDLVLPEYVDRLS